MTGYSGSVNRYLRPLPAISEVVDAILQLPSEQAKKSAVSMLVHKHIDMPNQLPQEVASLAIEYYKQGMYYEKCARIALASGVEKGMEIYMEMVKGLCGCEMNESAIALCLEVGNVEEAMRIMKTDTTYIGQPETVARIALQHGREDLAIDHLLAKIMPEKAEEIVMEKENAKRIIRYYTETKIPNYTKAYALANKFGFEEKEIYKTLADKIETV
jgi:hypothetical protein